MRNVVEVLSLSKRTPQKNRLRAHKLTIFEAILAAEDVLTNVIEPIVSTWYTPYIDARILRGHTLKSHRRMF